MTLVSFIRQLPQAARRDPRRITAFFWCRRAGSAAHTDDPVFSSRVLPLGVPLALGLYLGKITVNAKCLPADHQVVVVFYPCPACDGNMLFEGGSLVLTLTRTNPPTFEPQRDNM